MQYVPNIHEEFLNLIFSVFGFFCFLFFKCGGVCLVSQSV